MATIEIRDHRRTDVRTNIRLNPFWMTSGVIDKDDDDKGALLFSFPDLADYFLHEIVVDVKTAFAGGTVALTIGSGTIATDDVTTGGDITIVDADEYMTSGEITPGSVGYYPGGAVAIDADGVVTGSDWAKAKFEGDISLLIIEGADANVPVIYASLTSDATITAGEAYVHILVSKLDRKH